ncbi:glycosyltransferase family 4 protein [Thalassotalea euphylliae]|uniref:Glycosyltransferase n=1 Tax=Thalassotalea euphylliae TaxID=1655234 RepID=A0A3E0UI26_9GAMM|nr:glycosyltransferase family 4 protein [Thalassotalea euphylliae]REL36526.1 glycosyltransferase [Thalassotalea euphylliae]
MAKRILVFDPVAYFGGSKQVAKRLVAQLPHDIEVWVATNDVATWQDEAVYCYPLSTPACLRDKKYGVAFYLKHLCYALQLLRLNKEAGGFARIVGLSGPTVDFALAILQFCKRSTLIQLVQGPVPDSRSAGFGLSRAARIFSLTTAVPSVKRALGRFLNSFSFASSREPATMVEQFTNAIDQGEIKVHREFRSNGKDSAKNHAKNNGKQQGVEILWSASLIKWKRLDVLLEALKILRSTYGLTHFIVNICYIKPPVGESSCVDIDSLSRELPPNVRLFEQPENLAQLRARSSIFVSTSEQEPFGLAILEALAAKLAVVVPSDGAYWDRVLEDGKDCAKYQALSPLELAQCLARLIHNPKRCRRIAAKGKAISKQYRAANCYSQITKALSI